MVVIEDVLTPLRVRGAVHCPDCVQLLPGDSAVSGRHPLICPVRMTRLRA